MMLSLDTAYRSFGGEVEASSTPTICRLSDSRRHQLWTIALICSNLRTAGSPLRTIVARLRSLGSNVIVLATADRSFIVPCAPKRSGSGLNGNLRSTAFGTSRHFVRCSDISEVGGRPEVTGRLS